MENIDSQTAEKLLRWYNNLACGCPVSGRISRVLGCLGGGIDAVSIRSRPHNESVAITEKAVPERISGLIEGVLLERALSRPELAVAAFDMSGELSFCSCNSAGGNYTVSSMTVWVQGELLPTSRTPARVTCPSCTVEYRGEVSDTDVKPIPLLTLFRRKMKQEVLPDRAETKQLYATLLGATGGCGIYNCSQQSVFNGSWTCLLFNGGKSTTIEAEVLVSNRISHSIRLQPICVCSELIYAILSAVAGPEFAYRVRDVDVIGGGEFLYYKYTIFSEEGPFDLEVTLENLVDSEPTSEPGCLVSAAAASNSLSVREDNGRETIEDTQRCPVSIPSKRKVEEASAMSTKNEVDVQSLLLTVLSARGGKISRAGSSTRQGTKRRRGGRFYHPPASLSSASAVLGNNKTQKCKADYILPLPQIEEKTIYSYQRHSHMTHAAKVTKHSVKIGERTFQIDVRPIKKRYVMPPSHLLFSPPLIMRTSFNSYRVISGAASFFDRIEIDGPAGATALSNNAAHSATLRVLSYIRENSLKRSIETALNKGLNVIRKTPTTNIGVPISSREIHDRQLCTATILSMLAGLAR
uniref:Wsv440-like protein n=1 Tax=Trachysalambria curvirostris nimavirus TaxID=2984282 RepID=A0A9C7F8D1_9VIRU|nr:MAG: wsv440-like protein [Trachysalambria curvirostris nimavirus]